jgi:TRAP-type mannitol/chloroaromatic compound transport system permease small subunit
MGFLRRAAAAIDRLNDGIGAAVSWLALFMVLFGAYNAIARYATRFVGVNLSSNALNELQWYLFSVVFLLGAAWGLRHDVHVRVDVLYGRLDARKKAWIDLLGTILFLLPFCGMMLWVSWSPVARSFAIREVSPDPGGLPRWPIKALLLVSFLLLMLQGFAVIVRQIDALRTSRAPEDPTA